VSLHNRHSVITLQSWQNNKTQNRQAFVVTELAGVLWYCHETFTRPTPILLGWGSDMDYFSLQINFGLTIRRSYFQHWTKAENPEKHLRWKQDQSGLLKWSMNIHYCSTNHITDMAPTTKTRIFHSPSFKYSWLVCRFLTFYIYIYIYIYKLSL
jgi:hypothetical protein